MKKLLVVLSIITIFAIYTTGCGKKEEPITDIGDELKLDDSAGSGAISLLDESQTNKLDDLMTDEKYKEELEGLNQEPVEDVSLLDSTPTPTATPIPSPTPTEEPTPIPTEEALMPTPISFIDENPTPTREVVDDNPDDQLGEYLSYTFTTSEIELFKKGTETAADEYKHKRYAQHTFDKSGKNKVELDEAGLLLVSNAPGGNIFNISSNLLCQYKVLTISASDSNCWYVLYDKSTIYAFMPTEEVKSTEYEKQIIQSIISNDANANDVTIKLVYPFQTSYKDGEFSLTYWLKIPSRVYTYASNASNFVFYEYNVG